jgi:plasmid stability protein
MKTTFDLPEDLVTEIKLKAAREHRKMKDVAAEALRKGLKAPDDEVTRDKADIERRLAILASLKRPDEAEHKALMDYLVEYREDRETAFDRNEELEGLSRQTSK